MKKLLLLVLPFAFPGKSFAEKKDSPPNIVFIMADDLGPDWVDYDDSNPEINTPNLQRLAETGMVFTKAYAACSVCSPTRAACMTGMSPAQIGMTTHIPGKPYNGRPGPKGGPRDAESAKHLDPKLPSYARELKKQGYVTGFIGKWHLAGEGSVRTKNGIVNRAWHPENYGFDSNLGGCAYGQPKSWFAPYRNGTIPNNPEKGTYLTDYLGDRAAAFIKANKDKPFHLIVRALDCRAITATQVPKVLSEWREPTHREFQRRNVWSLFNAVTETHKELNPHIAARRSEALHGLCDTTVGLAN